MALPKLMQPPKEFRFDEPPGRPFRICSVETELDGAAHALAGDLYNNGIVCAPDVQSYGWNPDSNHPHVAYLKYDGSVTGGELIFDRLDLTNPTHSAALMRAHERLRDLEKNGDVQYNPNCGGHIHMDAAGFGFWDLVRLMTVFGYCEEPIFRLAGAGKTYGHRTLYSGYDRANHGAGYSDPISKGPFGGPKAAWEIMRKQKRMSGLNTTIYLAQKDANGHSHGGYLCNGSCKGAREFLPGEPGVRHPIYDKKTCTCPPRKNTIEWRVWNAQGNPRILYAWIALMQAMHAFAWRPADDKKYPKHDPMPAFTWTWRPFSKLTEDERRLAQDRVQFMFHELPLTSEEKDALRYAFMRTPYKVFGKDWMKRQADTAYKPPEFPNDYKKTFKRKLGLNPQGKPWGDDSGVDYTDVPLVEPAPDDGRFVTFTDQIMRGMRDPNRVRMDEAPLPATAFSPDGARQRARNYSPDVLYQHYASHHLEGWIIDEGTHMNAGGESGMYTYRGGRWNRNRPPRPLGNRPPQMQAYNAVWTTTDNTTGR